MHLLARSRNTDPGGDAIRLFRITTQPNFKLPFQDSNILFGEKRLTGQPSLCPHYRFDLGDFPIPELVPRPHFDTFWPPTAVCSVDLRPQAAGLMTKVHTPGGIDYRILEHKTGVKNEGEETATSLGSSKGKIGFSIVVSRYRVPINLWSI